MLASRGDCDDRKAAIPPESLPAVGAAQSPPSLLSGLHGYRPRKEPITIRLDADVVAWFKSHSEGGRGYQSDINQVLRQYVATRTAKRRA